MQKLHYQPVRPDEFEPHDGKSLLVLLLAVLPPFALLGCVFCGENETGLAVCFATFAAVVGATLAALCFWHSQIYLFIRLVAWAVVIVGVVIVGVVAAMQWGGLRA